MTTTYILTRRAEVFHLASPWSLILRSQTKYPHCFISKISLPLLPPNFCSGHHHIPELQGLVASSPLPGPWGLLKPQLTGNGIQRALLSLSGSHPASSRKHQCWLLASSELRCSRDPAATLQGAPGEQVRRVGGAQQQAHRSAWTACKLATA